MVKEEQERTQEEVTSKMSELSLSDEDHPFVAAVKELMALDYLLSFSGLSITDLEKTWMWSYIWRKVYNTSQDRPTGEIVDPTSPLFWERYLEENGSLDTASGLATLYRIQMRFELHTACFDKEQILWLHKLLAIPVDDIIVENLKRRFNVDITLDGDCVYEWTDLL